MHRRTTLLGAALVGSLAIVAVACSGGDEVSDPTAETFETAVPTEPLFTRTSDAATAGAGDGAVTAAGAAPDTSGDAAPATDVASTASTAPAGSDPATTLATVPDTGVPGIDSEDEFCRSWSEFAGSFQALAGAWAIGDQAEAARSELAASAVILDATVALDEHLPDELESERAAMAALVEPLARRAGAAREEQSTAGIDEQGAASLGVAWIDALVAYGVDDPSIAIVVPADVDGGAFAAAAAAFAAARPGIVDDPSLITEVQIPLTEQYLIANCPDQGTLGGNDDVGGG